MSSSPDEATGRLQFLANGTPLLRFSSGSPFIPIASFREEAARHPLLPLEDLSVTPRAPNEHFRRSIDRTIAGAYRLGGSEITVVPPPIDWYCGTRSFKFHVHAWDPIADILTFHGHSGEEHYFDVALDFASDWLNRIQHPVLDSVDESLVDRLTGDHEDMAWYDMGVGQRLYRLAYILDVIARRPDYSDALVDLFLRSYFLHHLMLSRDSFFRANNHGFYQAICQLAAARRFRWLPEVRPFEQLSAKRTSYMIDAQYSSTGVHCEHSPGYHFAILTTLVGAARSGVLDDPETLERIRSFEEALVWMGTPDNQLALLGDTDPRSMDFGPEIAGRFLHPQVQWMLSGGKLGEVPAVGVKAYPQDGFAFARLMPPDAANEPGSASYIAQTAAFNSRAHKHADNLSFVWYDRGKRVLIDPGRFAYAGRSQKGNPIIRDGFWYDDPRRVYVESTRSHNTVDIDGRNHQRIGLKPFGSALLSAVENNGMFLSFGELLHYEVVRHSRLLVMRPGHFLLVIDRLRGHDGNQHKYRQWFHFDPDLCVKIADGIGFADRDGFDASQSFRFGSLYGDASWSRVFRGDTTPEYMGWISDKENSLVPSSSVAALDEGKQLTYFATIFVSGDTLVPEPWKSSINTPLTRAVMSWQDRFGSHNLVVRRDADGVLSARLR